MVKNNCLFTNPYRHLNGRLDSVPDRHQNSVPDLTFLPTDPDHLSKDFF